MSRLNDFMESVVGFFARWWFTLALGAVILLIPVQTRPGQPVERHFKVEASRFAYSPSILHVNRGDRVTIELAASDVVHGLAVDGYGLEVISDPGETARLSFVADKPGSFRFRCTVTCGAMHPFMIGKIQVGENTLLWRAAGLAVLVVGALLWRRF